LTTGGTGLARWRTEMIPRTTNPVIAATRGTSESTSTTPRLPAATMPHAAVRSQKYATVNP